ncbi:MAG: hypothetical protein V1797_07850 [Pseudomonadota bacterium]
MQSRQTLFGLGVLAGLALILASGCAEMPATARPEAGSQAGSATVSGNNYLNKDFGLYWMAPAGYKALPPQAEPGLLVTWQAPHGSLKAMMWLLTDQPTADLSQAGAKLAAGRGWQALGGREITWQGQPCWDANYKLGDKQVRVRLLRHRLGLLAVAVQTPAAEAEQLKAETVTALEGARLLPQADVLHTTKLGGESLDLVALWYTGRADNWKRLRAYNRLNSASLAPGQEVLIPRELVWRLDPMPGWMLRYARTPAAAKPTRAPAKAAEPAPEEPGEGITDLEMAPTGPK